MQYTVPQNPNLSNKAPVVRPSNEGFLVLPMTVTSKRLQVGVSQQQSFKAKAHLGSAFKEPLYSEVQ